MPNKKKAKAKKSSVRSFVEQMFSARPTGQKKPDAKPEKGGPSIAEQINFGGNFPKKKKHRKK